MAVVSRRRRGQRRSPQAREPAAAAAKGAPKFKDDQGDAWSGRGPRPGWFKAALEAGKSADDLLAK